ncbi:MAG: T6SS effector BTH_I2691 family protein, partial [Pseudomonadota bacterium]
MATASRMNAHAVEGVTADASGSGCKFCERKGLPILPVRYAVCQRNGRNSGIPELDETRVQEFTNIRLDQSLDDNGNAASRTVPAEIKSELSESTGTQVNKYILRQLRQGYLYFYDQDNPRGMHWYAYAITSDGKFYQFPVAHPEALDKITFPEACNAKANDALHASLVTLPDPDNSGTLYYAFSEHAWPIEHIRMIGNNPAWREANMQKVDVKAWVDGQSQPHAFGTDDLGKVAEYSDSADDLGTQFWSSGPRRELYSREDLKDAMDLRLDHAASRYHGKGLILAVKDEAGIIDELNAYRHQALAEVEDFVCASDANRRKLLCKQAIDAFKENFAQNYTATQKKSLDEAVDKARAERDEFQEKSHSDDASRRERAQSQRTRNQLNHAVREAEADRENFLLEQQRGAEERAQQKRQLQAEIEELKRLRAEREQTLVRRAASRDETVASQARVLQQDPFYDNEIQRKQFVLNSIKSEAERMAEKHAAQLDELYDTKALKDFADRHEKRTRACEARLALHDSDYTLWVKHHLADLIGRYSDTDYWMGLGLSGLLANTLRGGILSPASGSLWQMIAETMTDEGSVILAALFSNNAELIRQARDTMASVPAGSQLS